MTFRPRPSLWFRSACPRGLAWNSVTGPKFVVAVLPLMLLTPASNGQEPQHPTLSAGRAVLGPTGEAERLREPVRHDPLTSRLQAPSGSR